MDVETQLTDDQKQVIKKYWAENLENRPSIIKLTETAFGKKLSSKSNEARLVKSFVSELSKEEASKKRSEEEINAENGNASQDFSALENLISSTTIEVPDNEDSKLSKARDIFNIVDQEQQQNYSLTNQEKEYVKNNIAFGAKPIDMAKILFRDPTINYQDVRFVAFNEYYKELKYGKGSDSGNEMFSPPKDIIECAKRVNKQIPGAYDLSYISKVDEKSLKALLSYLSVMRVVLSINAFDDKDDRALFESSFIRYTYDKPDLTQEEVDQYVVLCSEIIIARRSLKKYQEIEEARESIFEETGEMDNDLIKSASSVQGEYNDSIKRQKQLISDLTTTRSKKIERKLDETSSLLALVELMKEEESRKEIIEIGQERNRRVEEDISRIMNEDELIGRIIGMTRNKALYG